MKLRRDLPPSFYRELPPINTDGFRGINNYRSFVDGDSENTEQWQTLQGEEWHYKNENPTKTRKAGNK